MLSEEEVRQRAKYCYCVALQLNWLCSNESIDPSKYWEYAQKSSLHLGDDEFIRMTTEEAQLNQQSDGGLEYLISLYEAFSHAFCEVLQIEFEEIKNSIPTELLHTLASEVGVNIKL